MNKENRENKEREKLIDQEAEGISKLGKLLVDSNSSVEVGYGFYDIRSELLIVNDMYWWYCKPVYMLNCMLA